MRQLRLREVKCLAQCHPAKKQTGQNLDPRLCEDMALMPIPVLLMAFFLVS